MRKQLDAEAREKSKSLKKKIILANIIIFGIGGAYIFFPELFKGSKKPAQDTHQVEQPAENQAAPEE